MCFFILLNSVIPGILLNTFIFRALVRCDVLVVSSLVSVAYVNIAFIAVLNILGCLCTRDPNCRHRKKLVRLK